MIYKTIGSKSVIYDCINTNNLDQKDSDNDRIGDACDEKDSRFTENKGLIWGVIVATILIVGVLAWRLSKKPLK